MKRLIASLLALLLLAGCGQQNAASPEPAKTPSKPVEAPTPPVPPVQEEPHLPPNDASFYMPIPDVPQEADVLNIYAAAAQVWEWFDLNTLPSDRSDKRTEGERTYYRVDGTGIPTLFLPEPATEYFAYRSEPTVSTLSDLRFWAEEFFTPEIVNTLFALSPDQYAEFDGALYAQGGGRGYHLYLSDKTVTAEQLDADHWVVTVTFYADSWDWEQPAVTIGWSQAKLDFEKTAAGWKFTSFVPSDGLDLDAETVFTFTYDLEEFDQTDFDAYTDLQLALYLLHAEGAYTAAPSDALFSRFLEDPAAVISALAPLLPDWQYTITELISGAAWYWHPDSSFNDLLENAVPANDAEQTVIDTLKDAYEAAQGDPAGPMDMGWEFSLMVNDGILTLGPQAGTFPWGHDLKGQLVYSGSADTYGTAYQWDCGDFQLSYCVFPDGTEYLYKLVTEVPYEQTGAPRTARGSYCGYSGAHLRRAYPTAVLWSAGASGGWDACYAYQPAEAGTKYIAFYLTDGEVARIEIEDLMDGRILP